MNNNYLTLVIIFTAAYIFNIINLVLLNKKNQKCKNQIHILKVLYKLNVNYFYEELMLNFVFINSIVSLLIVIIIFNIGNIFLAILISIISSIIFFIISYYLLGKIYLRKQKILGL
ncbi:MAG: hypothetical protein ACK5HL_04110 [Bacilli bacterium]